jgi:hypothetical protein
VALNRSVPDFENYLKNVTNGASVNYTDKATYIDVISYFENAKLSFLKDKKIKDTELYFKDLTSYSSEEQAAIMDMVANEILYPVADKLNGNDYVFKGQLNEIVVNFCEKYSTIAMQGDIVCTDPEKIPSTAIDFPYISVSASKEAYEKPLTWYDDDFQNPATLYNEKSVRYDEMISLTERYLNLVLNVDYQTIDREKFKRELKDVSLYSISDSMINRYLDYVQSNKIQVSTTVKIQKSMIYFSGIIYGVRTEAKLNVISCNDGSKLIFPDWYGQYVNEYKKGESTKIFDVPVSMYFNVDEYAIYVTPLWTPTK